MDGYSILFGQLAGFIAIRIRGTRCMPQPIQDKAAGDAVDVYFVLSKRSPAGTKNMIIAIATAAADRAMLST